jgi:hypothetical protein
MERPAMTAIRSVGLMIALLWGPATAVAQPAIPGPPNDCSHPYWRDTLRCRDIGNRGDLPQPNAASRPATVEDLKEYTRVFFGGPTLRCVDGTKPVLYVAPAVCTDPAGCSQTRGGPVPYGAPITSNDWIISFVGGGACHAQDKDGDGLYEDGSYCSGLYPIDKTGMSTAFDPPMKNLEGSPNSSGGILSRRPSTNPMFAAYNSVRVEKCSYDRYLGRTEYEHVSGSLRGSNFEYTLFTHGQRIAEAAIQQLKTGLAYTTWADPDNDGDVDDIQTRLPRLADARQVLFIGHSGGAHGMRHNIDRLASLVKRSKKDADVRVLLDANFLPSIEGEAAFNGAGGDEYSDVWTGSSTASGQPFRYDGDSYHRESLVGEQLTSWKTLLDESCLAAHSPDTRWKCRDRQHVTFNHIATPMFIREDFLDPNMEHTDDFLGHPIPWALRPGCSYSDLLPGSPCYARFATTTEHRLRLSHLAATLLAGIDARSELARGVDASLPAGQVPAVYLWMPACAAHEGAYSDAAFQHTAIIHDGVSTTMRAAVESFASGPTSNVVDWRISGSVGGRMMTSHCPAPR